MTTPLKEFSRNLQRVINILFPPSSLREYPHAAQVADALKGIPLRREDPITGSNLNYYTPDSRFPPGKIGPYNVSVVSLNGDQNTLAVLIEGDGTTKPVALPIIVNSVALSGDGRGFRKLIEDWLRSTQNQRLRSSAPDIQQPTPVAQKDNGFEIG